ncbi:hypothetical protein P154DRAFT_625777 [Amniculicola lignicola CBS 123094]|uniref:Glycinamide ribonucleotide synthetase n=1 Tax=Amniculicola lignicola CBS 123094 TaxID=1392246 RepID=A0A6A5VW45_9PLEO|nr:hypothetical protein P154DRAFT_625777 [Amniculicola lignicola CBS 123094]
MAANPASQPPLPGNSFQPKAENAIFKVTNPTPSATTPQESSNTEIRKESHPESVQIPHVMVAMKAAVTSPPHMTAEHHLKTPKVKQDQHQGQASSKMTTSGIRESLASHMREFSRVVVAEPKANKHGSHEPATFTTLGAVKTPTQGKYTTCNNDAENGSIKGITSFSRITTSAIPLTAGDSNPPITNDRLCQSIQRALSTISIQVQRDIESTRKTGSFKIKCNNSPNSGPSNSGTYQARARHGRLTVEEPKVQLAIQESQDESTPKNLKAGGLDGMEVIKNDESLNTVDTMETASQKRQMMNSDSTFGIENHAEDEGSNPGARCPENSRTNDSVNVAHDIRSMHSPVRMATPYPGFGQAGGPQTYQSYESTSISEALPVPIFEPDSPLKKSNIQVAYQPGQFKGLPSQVPVEKGLFCQKTRTKSGMTMSGIDGSEVTLRSNKHSGRITQPMVFSESVVSSETVVQHELGCFGDYRLVLLVLGGGSREHALAWKLSESHGVEHVFVAPGNSGTGRGNPKISNIGHDYKRGEEWYRDIAQVASSRGVNIVIVSDHSFVKDEVGQYFLKQDILCLAPPSAALLLEHPTKANEFMLRNKIPSCTGKEFRDAKALSSYCKEIGNLADIVIKRSDDPEQIFHARQNNWSMLGRWAHDALTKQTEEEPIVYVEPYLKGREIVVTVLCDGEEIVQFPACEILHGQEVFVENSTKSGLAAPFQEDKSNPGFQAKIDGVILSTISGLIEKNISYRGCLSIRLRITHDGLKVVGYRVGFQVGETEAILPLLSKDVNFAHTLMACLDGSLNEVTWAFNGGFTVCSTVQCCLKTLKSVHPGSSRRKINIEPAKEGENAQVFHDATKLEGKAMCIVGHRLVSVVASGESLQEAREHVRVGTERVRMAKTLRHGTSER